MDSRETKGRINVITVNNQWTVASNMVLGFGAVMVKVTLQNSETNSVIKQKSARLILFYIKI